MTTEDTLGVGEHGREGLWEQGLAVLGLAHRAPHCPGERGRGGSRVTSLPTMGTQGTRGCLTKCAILHRCSQWLCSQEPEDRNSTP